MEIILYNNMSTSNTLSKTIEHVVTLIGDFREDVSVLNPSIIIEDTTIVDYKTKSYVLKSNYLYIPDLQRYYFINNVNILRANIYLVNCHIDVLMTYRDVILSKEAYVLRNKETFNRMIQDSYAMFEPETITTRIPLTLRDFVFSGYNTDDRYVEKNVVVNMNTTLLQEVL